MKKIIFIFALVLIFPMSVSASGVSTVTLTQTAMPITFSSQTFDNLVLNFKITPANADVLQTLTVANQGTARPSYEVSNLILWADDGDGQFDGFGIDKQLGVGTYDANYNQWVFPSLNYSILTSGHDFYVSVETHIGGVANSSYQFSIPKYYDANNDGAYQQGDAGIFLNSKEFLPTMDLVNGSSAAYRSTGSDSLAPVAVITNLTNEQTITDNKITLIGQAKDQGGSFPALVQVCFDLVCGNAVSTGDYFSTWKYDLSNIVIGQHTVYAVATDFNDNRGQSATITFHRQDNTSISPLSSSVSIDKTTIIADGSDKTTISVTLVNDAGTPIPNKTVNLNEVRDGVNVVTKFKDTDANGQAVFTISSAVVGSHVMNITTNSGELIRDNFTLIFVKPAVSYTDGSWIKLASGSAVYFLDKNNVRHPYPTQAVWQSYFGNDFSNVKVVSADVMAGYEMGKNVPFKVGTLIKIPSVPKVYEVGNDSALHWITAEAKAISLYGTNWASLVKDLPEAFFQDYTVGTTIQ